MGTIVANSKMMPNVSMEFIRGVLGLLCLFFGYMGGRSAAAVSKGNARATRLYTWILRMVVCSFGLVIRSPIDGFVVAIWGLEITLFGLGYWMVQNQRPAEDLTREIFPE
jgi:hypothetical protein